MSTLCATLSASTEASFSATAASVAERGFAPSAFKNK
jgi:hypothetical protein